MDGSLRSKSQPRAHRSRRGKECGSKTYSSSDEEFHSDDNLRPYEEVKVAHHDKKLSGLGWSSAGRFVGCPLDHADQSTDLYSYASGSDGDIETDYAISPHHLQLQPRNNPSSQTSISSEGLDSHTNGSPGTQSKLSDSDAERETALTYSQAGTLQLPPPSLPPPPPPPPIEDIPQRSPVSSTRRKSFGPSSRGNYSEVDNSCRRYNYSESESDFEPHYLVQTPSGNVFVPTDAQPRFPRTVPRAGQAVAAHGPNQPGRQVGSDSFPRHFQNGDQHAMNQASLDRWLLSVPNNMEEGFEQAVWAQRCGRKLSENPENWVSTEQETASYAEQIVNSGHGDDGHAAFTFPQFGATPTVPMATYPTSQEYSYYSKFSNASHRVKKQLKQRCSWKCMALILLIICVALLACVAYFAAMLVFEEREKVAHDAKVHYVDGALNSSRTGHTTLGRGGGSAFSTTALPTPSVVRVGQVQHQKVPPKTFWQSQFTQTDPGFVKLNFTMPDGAVLGVYGRKNLPPTHVQFDFFEVFNGKKVIKRSLPWREGKSKNTAIIRYLPVGTWYLAVYNDNEEVQQVSFVTDIKDSIGTGCQHDCYGHGECKNGRCHCYPGYTGKYCGQTSCPVLCSGNGYYDRGVCHCHLGWKGQECETPANACQVPTCNGNGECIHGQCVCQPGFQGPDCGIVGCISNCTNHGICKLGECICFQGYKGKNCSIPDKINVTELCAKDCSGHGTYDVKTEKCICERHFTGKECETGFALEDIAEEVCRLDCFHGYCDNQECVCHEGWRGALCDMLACDPRCDDHGFCNNGTCICKKGWNGKHCTLNGCPKDCNRNGECQQFENKWRCSCNDGWKGRECKVAIEMRCEDEQDNDNDGLRDCQDPDCCKSMVCEDNVYCKASPNPLEILLRKQPPSTTASFFEKMRFLVEDNSVQTYATRHAFNESQVSVIRGKVETKDGSPLVGVRVGVVTQPLYGYTYTRSLGMFDILVNGGGSVTLQFNRDPFPAISASVLVPWNQIITMDTVVMTTEDADWTLDNPILCNFEHEHYLLRPVVLSTWQHTQLGACPEKSTVIPESQVLQESLPIPGTRVNLVYHSSESAGYMSVIMIQMTPKTIPDTLAVVYLKVSVEGIIMEKVFEADPNLKYTFSWDRRNAYRQKVYGIVTARVFVGYQYENCEYIFWETRSTTMSGYDLTSSEIGGWNLDIHHTYNFQEGILHKGDGTNIYLKEKPKKLVNILGNGRRRKLLCDDCNGKALDKRLLAPVALASGLDGSLYVGDYNLVRKLSPSREEVASILQMSTSSIPYKYYMTVSPVDGRLYISDFMSHKILRVKTMGPVRKLEENFEVIAGNGEECTPGEAGLCGDSGLAIQARLRHPKGIAINKDGITYIADGPNIRLISVDGRISTLIGSQEQLRKWTPLPCDNIVSADEVSLRWPTALAIDPLDDTLHILDNNVVLKLTADKKLVTVAGRPAYCPPKQTSFLPSGVLTDNEQASSIADHVTLVSPESMTFGPHGDLYIVESDTHQTNRVRVVSTDGRIHHFAGAKSKCDCQKTNCKCYDSKETLAAQALFNTPTSITVTPDGVMHIADMGNLRLYSIVSELPQPNWLGQYEVMSPETQELYIFNRYGQHQHTVNIMTNLYMYNYTYNVNSFYGKLIKVIDAAENTIQISRGYDTQARDIIAPDGSKCKLLMDNIRRLQRFITPNNKTATFSYLSSTGLLVSKHMSDGKTYFYEYDEMGRLLKGSQPTGEITTLETDVNTTGSIVHVTTDSSDAVALATYGRVQSVLHGWIICEGKLYLGSVQTKVTYLPDGAVVVVFPTNLTVAMETGGHPILEREHRMHFKRKVIVPNTYIHRLEWRFYLRRVGRTKQSDLIERIGHRMRVGSYFSWHANMHDSHEDGYKGKALLINGENLLTVEYNRNTNTETVMDRDMREILTVVYNSAGHPTHFLPATGHHYLNISYTNHGNIQKWQYGDLQEQRMYEKGMPVEKLSTNGAQYRYIYRYGLKPTDVILPSGKQYLFHYDMEGNLIAVTMPNLGRHCFAYVTTIGFQRVLYYPPKSSLPFIKDTDGNGKLLQIIYPSEQKRIVFRYNDHFQPTSILFDNSHISYQYDSETAKLTMLESFYTDYACQHVYQYSSSLVRNIEVKFQQDRQLLGAKSFYNYDNNFRLTQIHVIFSNNETTRTNYSYDQNTGKLASVKYFSFNWPLPGQEKVSDDYIKIVREYDKYGQLRDEQYKFGETPRFMLHINYDQTNRIHQWRRRIGQTNTQAIEYVYNIDNNVIDVLLEGQSAWRYGYDANGNVAKVTNHGRTKEMHFDEADHIKKFGEKKYKFDPDGFMVQRNKEHLNFNSLGQLLSVTRSEEYKVLFYYDPRGRLVAYKDTVGNVLQYFYMNIENPARVTHTYNHSTGDTTQYHYDHRGRLIAMERRGNLYYIANDPIDTPLVVFDNQGHVVKQMSYDPLGWLHSDSNPHFEFAFGFQGGIHNPITNLIHLNSKVYDPQIGRWLAPSHINIFDKLKEATEKPEILNRYQHSHLVNLHMTNRNYPFTDLAEWLLLLGFDVQSLAPDVSYTGEIRGRKKRSRDFELLPTSSAFECTFRRDMDNLLTMTTVPPSKITPKQQIPELLPAPVPFLLGDGIILSVIDDRVIVNFVDSTPEMLRKVASVLLNNSDIINMQFTIRGKDVHYFYKVDVTQAEVDLGSLAIRGDMVYLENGINISVHRIQHTSGFHARSHEEIDIRLHGNYSIINIRYGTDMKRERRRVLQHAKERAVQHAWGREKYLLQNSLPSMYQWSEQEKYEIITVGYAEAYEGIYIRNPEEFPELADDCNNIRLLKRTR